MLLFYLKIRYFWSKIGIKVNNTFLVVDQINYTTKTLNGYILACLYAHIFRMLSIKKLACLVRLIQQKVMIKKTEQYLPEKMIGILEMNWLGIL